MYTLHLKPNSTKHKKNNVGFVDVWNLKNLDSVDVTFHTVAGGKETIIEDKSDRILIAVSAFATLLDTKQVVSDGAVIEIPAGTSLRFQGQMKYYLIKVTK